ncbi:MAG TPA: adenosylcobinamide-phosphate synthase CbiB [Accumulibacter sp.]|nr:adenosylcobinamide-phosphate synthase CbiB [Accumulibacter sp.]HMW17233.1 adenosylcobinamide-phosphate synthase CbiB [Accumulibacter sp.]HMX23420.1 adenosylcobinamide-phosphate synthase CbiB [Accumulibacter sp.]HMY07382.1 adenosylcobinamide-phosphate synthase CbiB [Accumulibacter sp.]HNC18496.1 adenosylcobinamide-phosphate synthase CbiB [Accumulibacter sp.]
MPVLETLQLPLCAVLAVWLDRLLGEPSRCHPLVGFGRLAQWIETALRRLPGPAHEVGDVSLPAGADSAADERNDRASRAQKNAGIAAWALAVLPFTALALVLRQGGPIGLTAAVDVVLLYFALGAQSLHEHVERVASALTAGDLPGARQAVGCIVSRETAALDENAVARAAVESALENGNDAIFGALFWFAVLGGPGALLFRLANTLDAMWGYRNQRYRHFGWAAARLDDLLGYLPARLCALSYAALGRARLALVCWREQAPRWDSPNAGPVMAAGAGSLGVRLGGASVYHGQREDRPLLGRGPAPKPADIHRAWRLVRGSMILWLIAGFALALLMRELNA